jgi:hypothetical protein
MTDEQLAEWYRQDLYAWNRKTSTAVVAFVPGAGVRVYYWSAWDGGRRSYDVSCAALRQMYDEMHTPPDDPIAQLEQQYRTLGDSIAALRADIADLKEEQANDRKKRKKGA